jgi:hypothetical protein
MLSLLSHHSRISLIQHLQGQTGAGLSSIPDYQAVPKFHSQALENLHLSVILISS